MKACLHLQQLFCSREDQLATRSLVQFQFGYRLLFWACICTLSNPDGENEKQVSVGVSVVTKAQTTKANESLTHLHDLNAHLNLENSVTMEDFVQRFLNKTPQPIFFERLHDVTLSRFQYRGTSLIDFGPYKNIFPSLIEYANGLKRSLHHYADIKGYSSVNSDQPSTYEEESRTQ